MPLLWERGGEEAEEETEEDMNTTEEEEKNLLKQFNLYLYFNWKLKISFLFNFAKKMLIIKHSIMKKEKT